MISCSTLTSFHLLALRGQERALFWLHLLKSQSVRFSAGVQILHLAMARSRRGLPIVTGDQEPLVSAFMGKDFNEILPTHDSSIHIASGNARQINGPVTTTFTGPIDKVEAHFAEIPQTSLERKLLEWLRPPSQSRHHKEVYKTHAVDTSRWFLDGEEFKSWLDGSTPLLWINGAGKYHSNIRYRSHLTEGKK